MGVNMSTCIEVYTFKCEQKIIDDFLPSIYNKGEENALFYSMQVVCTEARLG